MLLCEEKMVKENIEDKAKKAVLRIDKRVKGIYDVLSDLSLKLCHIIKDRQEYFKSDKEYSNYK